MALLPPGMLFVASEIDPSDEDDFNAWYDREHIEERVRMDGVISAARYVSVESRPKYLSLYWAESLSTFASKAYTYAFQNQTPWSTAVLKKMRAPTRRIGEVRANVGQGSGGWVAILPLNALIASEELIEQCRDLGERLSKSSGFVHSYLLTPSDELSRPLPLEDLSARRMLPILIIESSSDASNRSSLHTAMSELPCAREAAARYSLTWKLAAEELA